MIRIKSNGKYIYSSYNPKNNKENINKLEKIFYSNENGINFDVNQTCFNDVCIEVMHKGEKTFRLLFIIQFNTFFISNNFSIKFDKEHIDSINQDIRYPNNFCLELNFDGSKEEKLSPFDEYSITWKTMLSEFIVKGLSKNKENNNIINKEKKAENKIENKNENININNKEMINENKKEEINKENKKENDEENIVIDTEIKKDKEKKEENEEGIVEKKEEIIKKEIKEDKDEDILNTIGNTNNTLNQVNDLLKKIEGNNDNEKEEENEDDEDIENYLKNLENK